MEMIKRRERRRNVIIRDTVIKEGRRKEAVEELFKRSEDRNYGVRGWERGGRRGHFG